VIGADAAAGAWTLALDAGASYVANLTRAAARADRRADRVLSGGIGIGYAWLPTGYDTVALIVDTRGAAYDRYPGLDFASVGATLRYRRKLALGIDAPYVVVSASAGYADYRDDVRDGSTFRLHAAVGRRFDEMLAVNVGVGHDRRQARSDVPLVPGVSGAIFEIAGSSLDASVDYAFDSRWQASGRTSARRGDVESTSRRNRAVFVASTAIADDPAFRDPELFGYRLRGTTLSAAVSLSYAVHDRASLNVGYLHESTRAAEGIRYRSRSVEATVVYGF
jgi:hypothetical protein